MSFKTPSSKEDRPTHTCVPAPVCTTQCLLPRNMSTSLNEFVKFCGTQGKFSPADSGIKWKCKPVCGICLDILCLFDSTFLNFPYLWNKKITKKTSQAPRHFSHIKGGNTFSRLIFFCNGEPATPPDLLLQNAGRVVFLRSAATRAQHTFVKPMGPEHTLR